jgi:trehalose 6-phosphate synthase/phosphatase
VFAEHGAVYRLNGQWEGIENDLSWRDGIIGIMQEYATLTPGSNIEIKENSVVWHYRKSDSDLAHINRAKLIERLTPSCIRANLTIMKGRKIIEVKPSDYTKGTAIMNIFDCSRYDFILAAGDDKTDEDLFKALPEKAVTVHVGRCSPISTYTIRNSVDFVAFLETLAT